MIALGTGEGAISPMTGFPAPLAFSELEYGEGSTSTGSTTAGDATVQTITNNSAPVENVHVHALDGEPVSYENLTPAAAVHLGDGVFRVTGTGPLRVTVRRQRAGERAWKREVAVPFPASQNVTQYAVQSYAEGSWVRQHNDALEAAMGSGTGNLFTDGTATAWNTGAWFADWLAALSGISRNLGTNCTLLTKRHAFSAAHYSPGVGAQVSFLGTDNTVHTRTVSEKNVHIPGVSYWGNDRAVLLLDSDLPATVRPLKVIPDPSAFIDNVADELGAAPGLVNGAWGPHVIWPDFSGVMRSATWAYGYDYGESTAYSNLLIGGVDRGPEPSSSLVWIAHPQANPTNQRDAFAPYHGANYRAKASVAGGGNSSKPVLLPLPNGDLGVILVYGSPNNGSGFVNQTALLNHMIAAIDAMRGISTGYTVTEADLDQYP